jgi:hypothetical protein
MVQQPGSAASSLEVVFTGVKLVYPWGRHFLRVCQMRIVRRCKCKEFQGFENSGASTTGNSQVWYRYIRRRFPVFFNDLRMLRGFEVLWALRCKFSGDEGLSVFKTV